MSATYPMDMVRGRITVQVHFDFYFSVYQLFALLAMGQNHSFACIKINSTSYSCKITCREDVILIFFVFFMLLIFNSMLFLLFADRQVLLPVQRDVPCSVNRA